MTPRFPLESIFTPEQRRRLLALREELHRHPELAFQEHRTAARLEKELSLLDPERLERVAGTGIIAIIPGRTRGAPMVAIRGDIDALPIQEETGLEFASEVAGVMHACGHDVHASWTIGAAQLLARDPAEGDVLILLQPAEETGRGAAAVLETGALDGVAAIFGAHVDRRFEVGQVVSQPGALAAAADEFAIELVGSGSHGARPHESADPIIGAAALISALQTVVSRRVNPAHPAVLSIGSIHGGSAANVIPERVTLTGTLRSLDPDTRKLLHVELKRISESIAAAHRLECRLSLELGPPPIVNPVQPAGWAQEAVARVLNRDAVVPLGSLNMAGEDFAHYMEGLPGCFLRVGAREPGTENIPAHTPRFYAAAGSIFVGAAVLAETARVASRALSGAVAP